MEMLSKLHLLWQDVNLLHVLMVVLVEDFHHLAEVIVGDLLMGLEDPLLVDPQEETLEEEAHLDAAVQIVEEVLQVLDLGLQIEDEKEVILLPVQDLLQRKEEAAPDPLVEVDLIPVEVDLDPNLSNHFYERGFSLFNERLLPI